MWGNINKFSLKSRGSVISAEDSREFVLKTRQCADGPYDSRFDPPRFRFQPSVQYFSYKYIMKYFFSQNRSAIFRIVARWCADHRKLVQCVK